MCGIAGIYAWSESAPPASQSELLAMRDSMTARGPDGAGEWRSSDGRVAMGHRRLAIIDLSDGGLQPMATADGAAVITFNGEIYNYRELRASLEQQGCRFRTSSDTEVILQLYQREGEAMLPRLRGMFAFAIWDSRRQGMLLARDPLGIKPLYYMGGKTFRFASQVKALVAGGAAGAEFSPAAAVSFFLLGYVADPFTIRRDVRSLEAGHSLWIDGTGVAAPKRFFSLRSVLGQAEAENDRSPVEDRYERLKESLCDSVGAHLIADVPVGVFLSSGLDSTSIMSLASAKSARLRTLTLGFAEYRGSPADEVPLAETVAGMFGTDHTTLEISRTDFAAEHDHLMGAMDQPTIDGVNSFFVSRAARQVGLKVALSGLGGDELFGGYPSFRQVPRIAAAFAPFRHVPGLGRTFRKITTGLIRTRTSPKFAGIIEYGTSIEDAYLLRRALFMPWELPEILDPEIARAGWRELHPLLSFRESTESLRSDRARVGALEMTWYMRNQLLRDTDWAGMAHSVEVRTPLVDAELLCRLAPLIVGHSAVGKIDMAKATPIGRVEAVMNRPKTGFTIPIREWLLGGSTSAPSERGLRGWAKYVFRQHVPH